MKEARTVLVALMVVFIVFAALSCKKMSQVAPEDLLGAISTPTLEPESTPTYSLTTSITITTSITPI